MKRRLWIAVAALLCAAAPARGEADYAREKRWADEITPAVLVGEPIYLAQPSGHRFLALYAHRANAPAGVIVVHGIGVHPDWGLINALRSGLYEQGYTTLSIQMPVLAADAKAESYAALYPEAAERLRVAVSYLRQHGERKVAIVSHSLGSRMSDEFLAGAPGGVDAWVSIGLTGSYSRPAALRFPVLDLFGENDLPGVRQSASERAAVLRGVRGSGQMSVAGADHFFAGQERELVQQVKLFLDHVAR